MNTLAGVRRFDSKLHAVLQGRLASGVTRAWLLALAGGAGTRATPGRSRDGILQRSAAARVPRAVGPYRAAPIALVLSPAMGSKRDAEVADTLPPEDGVETAPPLPRSTPSGSPPNSPPS